MQVRMGGRAGEMLCKFLVGWTGRINAADASPPNVVVWLSGPRMPGQAKMGKGQSQQGQKLELQVRHCSCAGLGGPDGPDGQQRWAAGRGDWAVLTWVKKSPVATGPC